ncbi:MAG: helix-turn-helix domain-containing protein [Acidobacteriota bacterium]|nr:helix-turn-helix domain-containing protein [Acidobacteriota bacterium]
MSGSSATPSPCAVQQLLPVLAGSWTLHILWILGNEGPTRFGELRRKVSGISARMLSDRLRLLESRGFVYRHYEPTIPPAVTYGITERMKDIVKVFEELDRLARVWAQEDSGGAKDPMPDGVSNELQP